MRRKKGYPTGVADTRLGQYPLCGLLSITPILGSMFHFLLEANYVFFNPLTNREKVLSCLAGPDARVQPNGRR